MREVDGMSRTALLSSAFLIACRLAVAEQPSREGALKAPEASAAKPSPATTTLKEDLHEVRLLIDQQSKQLDALAKEMAQMSQQLHDLHAGSAREEASGAPATATEPAGASEPVTPGEENSSEPPKAEAVSGPGGASRHTVAKGETLTSIAKHYNIPVVDIQKANKIVDDRKLQIGQILNIPPQKAPEPHTPKKEKP